MRRSLLVLMLLIAAALRIVGVSSISPPGLEHDEVANWLIDRSILEGNHAIYFTEAYGHEAGFHYVQTAVISLIGDHALALRLPTVFAGILLVAVTFALGRRLFGWQIGFWSMALTAVLFFPVFYSRLGLRAMLLPLLSGLSAYFWWQAWGNNWIQVSVDKHKLKERTPRSSVKTVSLFILAGLFAGLSLHTYMASRAVPLFYGTFTIYLAIFHWRAMKTRWRGVLLFWITLIAIAAPLFLYLQQNPASEFRITEIDAPLRALLAGNLRPILENGVKIGANFGFIGDPLWRQGVPDVPLLGVVLGLFFYAGVVMALWRWKDGRFAFLLLWLITAVSPSVVTVDAPSSIRMINLLPMLTLFPVVVMHRFGTLSTVIPKLSPRNLEIGVKLILTALVIWNIGRTIYLIFEVWPQNEEVAFVWQEALTETAVFLNNSPDSSPVTIGGWSPATMDPATMALALRRDDLDLRYIGSDSTAVPINTVIIPATDDEARLTHPAIRPIAPPLADALTQLGATEQVMGAFTLYTIPAAGVESLRERNGEETAVFGNELRLLATEETADSLITYWEVMAQPTGERRFFVHWLDADGNIIAQVDGLDAPAQQWRVGDLLIQVNTPPSPTDAATIRLGVYDPTTCETGACQNLLLEDGTGFLLIDR